MLLTINGIAAGMRNAG
ncbi:hypothetical protein [Microbacterium sp.]